GYTTITPLPNPNTGASNKLLQQLVEGMQSGYDEANAAGLEQYKNLLEVVTGLQQNVVGQGGIFDQAMGNIEGMGTSARQRVAENMQHQLGATEQDMTSRGLGNTTIRQSGLRGVRRDAEQAHQAIDEQVGAARSGLLLQKAGAMSDLGRLHADSILSR